MDYKTKETSEQLNTDNMLWLDNHLNEIRDKIVKRSKEILDENGPDITVASAIAEAAKEFAPGSKFPLQFKQSWWCDILSELSAVTLMSMLLAIVFGIIAYHISTAPAGSTGAGANPKDATSYIDLVKIFAGAIVGSTGAAVAASTKSRRKV
jgi:hypothetical protein